MKTQRIVTTGLHRIPESGAGLLAANHLNWKDVLFIGTRVSRQVHFVATNELFDVSLCRQMISTYAMQKMGKWVGPGLKGSSDVLARYLVPRVREIGTIPAKRSQNDRRVFELAKEALGRGKIVCIFPEGGTSQRGRLRRFKKGAAKMVYDLFIDGIHRLPIIPVGVKGTEKVFLPWRKLFLHLGKPLYIEDYLKHTERETLASFTELLEDRVRQLIDD